MIHQVLGLFRRYSSKHASVQIAGFPLWNCNGKRIGFIDRVIMREDRLWVEGWALSGLVGLSNEEQTVERTPNLIRNDVQTQMGETGSKTPGFVLDMPFSWHYTVFWAEVDGMRYVFPLPRFSLRRLKAARRAQLLPFLRDAGRAMPAGAHWLLHRDPPSAMRIKTALGLDTLTRSGEFNDLLFAEDVETEDRPPEALAKTGVTIVLPVYNAFDLLPEVLRRVVEHTDLPWRLIVIEDRSSDAQVRPWLRAWHEGLSAEVAARVTLIENETNLGFIRSVNRAFAVALPFGDHVVLLNSDAFVPARWASRLIRPILEHDNVATVTPMSNDAEIFDIPVICEREQLRPGEADEIDKVAARFFPGSDLADAPTGVGFCMAMNIDYLRKIPELDTSFGRGYGEEVDWCQRARQMGGRHLGYGGLFVEHRGGTSFGSAEKLKLVQKNNETIARRYPYYNQAVQDFISNDPLKTARMALAMAWAASRQKAAVPVYLAHSIGGGAEHYLMARVKADLAEGAAAVILRVGGYCRWQIEFHNEHGVTRGETDSTRFVRRLLGLLPARHIVYSCAVGDRDPIELPKILMSLAEGPDDWIEVLIHDFFPLSPSYTLLDSEGVYSGLPMPGAGTDQAHSLLRGDGSRADLGEWRAEWGRLINAAKAITVFSDDSREVVCQAYPQAEAKLKVKPHSLMTEVPLVQPGRRRDGVPVIGVLGNIGYHKGISVLRDLSEFLDRNGRARLVIIGNVDPAYALASSAEVHGDYRVEDIPALVGRYGISRWLIPSIWRETFSFTTHEAIATGLPVFCFDLGAQADAVRRAVAVSGQGGTIPLKKASTDLKAMLDTILNERDAKRDVA